MHNSDSIRVLLVDDDKVQHHVIKGFLKTLAETEYQLDSAYSFADAISTLQREHYDLILCDYYLEREKKGTDLLEHLKQHTQNVPMIVITQAEDKALDSRLIHMGAADYLEKDHLSSHILDTAIRHAIQRAHLEDKISQLHREKSSILSAIGEGVLVLSNDGLIEYANPAAVSALAPDEAYLVGSYFHDFCDTTEQMKAPLYPLSQYFDDSESGTRPFTKEFMMRKHEGGTFVAECTISRFTSKEEEISSFVVVLEDISLRKNLEEQLSIMACHDYLTKLPNRKLFEKNLSQAMNRAKHSGKFLALFFIDLDHFKSINDNFGHDAGDELLCEATNRLKACVREGDSIARLGGDEFTIIAEGIHEPDEAKLIAEKIQTTLGKAMLLKGVECYISASIGIAIFPEVAETRSDLIKASDTAMYFAKQSGRRSHQFYSEALGKIEDKKWMMETKLIKAIENDEFYLAYLPQIDLQTMEITGLEALLRWKEAERYDMTTEDCIRYAEENGSILPIGEWVFEQAISDFSVWKQQGLIDDKVTLAINVSSYQVKQTNLANVIETAFEKQGNEGFELTLEINEASLVKHCANCEKNLFVLQDMGHKIFIDDFGTGYSSLQKLGDMPIDGIKVDQSFIKKAADKEHTLVILQALMTMARSLGWCMVSEGLETEKDFVRAQSIGFHEGQGYWLVSPVTAEDMENFLKERLQLQNRA